MSEVQIAGAIIFVAGYLLITIAHKYGLLEGPIALVMAGILWILVSQTDVDFQSHLEQGGWEITQIVFFLLFAMALVELISRLGFFELVRVKLQQRGWKDKQQFIALMVMTYLLSSILDNLTTTIVMVEICRRFFGWRNLLVATAGIVPLANAGGAFSPIGDVTTIMLWLAGKYSASGVVVQVLLPSVVHGAVVIWLLARSLVKEEVIDSQEDLPLQFTPQAKILMGAALACFSLPFIATQFSLPPFIGLGLGFGLVATIIGFMGRSAQHPHGESISNPGHHTRLEHDIEDVLRQVDYASLMFFAGILLSVSALGSLGILDQLSQALFGAEPSFARIATGNIIMGWGSALVDNVPLTAVAIDTVPTSDYRLWSLLAYTVGTGGSHLLIGSAAGVVAMGRVKELNTFTYMRLATVPVSIAYLAGIAIWVVQQPFL